eukprot:1111914-Pyramimonas_sp.AAC.1
MRLDLVFGTSLLEKLAMMRRGQLLSVQHAHFMSRISVEHSCQIDGRHLAGREMMRAICVGCSVASESGQRWIC